MKKFMLIMSLGGTIFGWFARASQDGKITHQEITMLMNELAEDYAEATGKQIVVEL